MADIPQNTSYNPSQVATAMAKTSAMVGSVAPKKNLVAKSSALTNLANRSKPAPQQTPANLPPAPAESPAGFSPSQTIKQLGPITTPFKGSTKYEPGGTHKGIDIATPAGTPIPFVSSGRVVEVNRGRKQGDPGYGNYVIVEDSGGNKVRYSHLSDLSVNIGDYVQAGDKRIKAGNSGSTYSASGGDGSHLDLRISNMYGTYLDPYEYFKSIENYRKSV